MAWSISSSRFFFTALLLCLLCSTRTILANNEHLALEATHYHTLEVSSLLPSPTCNESTSKGSDGEGLLRVTHNYGPCSALKHGKTKAAPTIAEISRQDRLRAQFLRAKLFNKNPKIESKASVRIPAKAATAKVGRINYLVSLGLGTPPQHIALELDTGSDLAWTQCKECTSKLCYKQRDPYFDPSKSSTYAAAKCPSPLCSIAATGTDGTPICTSSKCLYSNTYGDLSYSVGYFSTETLTLTPSDVIHNFKFGCGINNTNGVSSDGVVGLARTPISSTQQLKRKYGYGFSYCFPAKTSQVGFFKFGSGGVSKNLKYTPLNRGVIGGRFYSVTIAAIKLGGKTLPIPSEVFEFPTILDSGTVYSSIQPTAYRILRAAFRREMTDFPRLKMPNDSDLDTCYSLGNHKAFRIPKMSIVFAGGATVNLATSGVVVPVTSKIVCLAYGASTDPKEPVILGNTLQHRLEMVYDIGKEKVGFGENAC